MDKYFKESTLTSIFEEKFSNQKSKGVDKISAKKFNSNKKEYIKLIKRKCIDDSYNFSPYLEKLKVKGRDKFPRLISIPTFRDRIVLYVLKEILHEKFPYSMPKKQSNQYLSEIKETIGRGESNYFFKTDILKFYDEINRKKLMLLVSKKIKDQRILNLISKAIKNPTVPAESSRESRESFIREKGIPQGLAISNILAQIYLTSIDTYNSLQPYFYFRYVDDILILQKESISIDIENNLAKELKKIDLALNKKKTEFGKVSNGITFLGYRIEKAAISVSYQNHQKIISRIAAKFTWFKDKFYNIKKRPEWIKDNDDRIIEVFMDELNELITGAKKGDKRYGWLYYFSEITDISLLYKLDKIVERFFAELDMFGFKKPKRVKRFVRAFYEIRYKNGGNYIQDYNLHDTIAKKRDFLIFRGAISSTVAYTNKEIEKSYKNYTIRRLRNIRIKTNYSY